MNYTNAKKVLMTCLLLYAAIGFGAHATRTSTEDVYPFFSWFLFVTVPPRIQSEFDIVLVSVDGNRLDTPAPLLERPEVFSGGAMSLQGLSAIAEQLARSVQEQRGERTSALRRELDTHFINSRASYVVRENTYDPIEYFKNKRIASSTILAEFRVGK